MLVDVACGLASFISLKKLLINSRWLGASYNCYSKLSFPRAVLNRDMFAFTWSRLSGFRTI